MIRVLTAPSTASRRSEFRERQTALDSEEVATSYRFFVARRVVVVRARFVARRDRSAAVRFVARLRASGRLPFFEAVRADARSGSFARPVSRFHSSNVSGEILPSTSNWANFRRCA
jgi:hypothetical protein